MERIWHESYPPEVPTNIDLPNIDLYEMFQKSAKRYGGRDAILFFGKRVTYDDLLQQVENFSENLLQQGVCKGDKVAIMLPNCPQFIISYFAILRIGGVVVAFNPMYTESEVSFQVEDSGSKVFITLDLFFEKLCRLKQINLFIVASLCDYLNFPLSLFFKIKEREKLKSLKTSKKEYKNFSSLTLNAGKISERPKTDPNNDIALLQYSGGTTGTPKGIMLSQNNILSNTLQCRSWFAKAEEGGETFLAVLPFFHAFGLITALNLPVYLGATILMYPKFDTKKIISLISRFRPTIFSGVPAMFKAIVENPASGKADMTSIKFCISGAAPLPEKVSYCFEKITGALLVEGYGLTEASPVTHSNHLYGKRKQGSIGVPLPGTDSIIINEESGTEAPFNEIGELLVKGPQIMQGYWRNKDETAAVLKDGWLCTGDTGYMDDDGFFFIVDRKKDIIISGGYNIYPSEVEKELNSHPKIQESAVIGVPDDRFGERPKAVVVPEKGSEPTEEEIIEFLKSRIAGYKVPQEVEFRSELPKTIIGKILKKELRK